MLAVKGYFDGVKIEPTEPLTNRTPANVIILFVDQPNPKNVAASAREKLRASAKGAKLTEKLLQARREDLKLEQK